MIPDPKSKPLAELLREKAAAVESWMREVPTGTPSCSRRAEEAYRDAAEMVESRDAELARLRAQVADDRDAISHLSTCTDEALELYDDARKRLVEAEAERDRLRAALEEIDQAAEAQKLPEGSHLAAITHWHDARCDLWAIARRALGKEAAS